MVPSRMQSALGVFVMVACLAGSNASAGDGVIEINHAVVDASGGFPYAILESGSYRLTENLAVSSTSSGGIRISSGDVTLNLNGFTVYCADASCLGAGRHGIYANDSFANDSAKSNVAVLDGSVRSFGGDGVHLPAPFARVDDVHAISNLEDGFDLGDSCVVRHSTARDNIGTGIRATATCTGTDNSASGNGTQFDPFLPGQAVPTGAVLPYAGAAAPEGWLVCDGAVLLQSANPGLYAALGSLHGDGTRTSVEPTHPSSGFGAGHFNLPDYRGRFLRGVDEGAGRDLGVTGRDRPTGALGGGSLDDAVGSVQGDQFKQHTHPIGIQAGGEHNGTVVAGGEGSTPSSYSATAPASGNPTSEDSRPKNAYVIFIIKCGANDLCLPAT